MNSRWRPVIGLEVHVRLATRSKLFCSCPNEFVEEPNLNICPICTGQPGVLPVLNREAVHLAVRAALALNCRINNYSVFARKHYFYPDLPKNYQISQYDKPLAVEGYIPLSSGRRIRLVRIHLEEDAGKLIHEGNSSFVDFNRAGTPLIEIVSYPDISSPQEAKEYLENLKSAMKYAGVSDCDMEKGSLRVDANVSVTPVDSDKLGTKVELKNLNSFRAVEKALEYEIKRQVETIENGGEIVQETRLWNEKKGITETMRTKEEAHDYRYFPEPDLPPLIVEDSFIEKVRAEVPELPWEKRERFKAEYSLPDYDASVLTMYRGVADFYEEVVRNLGKELSKDASNWIMTELMRIFKEKDIEPDSMDEVGYEPSYLAELIKMVKEGTITGSVGKSVLMESYETGKSPSRIVEEKNLAQVSDESALEKVVQEVIAENPKPVEDYKSGKKNAIGFLIGQVMRKMKGRANPNVVREILQKHLG